MPRTDLYTRLHCVTICITVSSIAQCMWHPICGRALYNAYHQRDSKMCTNIYIICIKAISISALDKQLQKCCNIYNAKCSLGSFEQLTRGWNKLEVQPPQAQVGRGAWGNLRLPGGPGQPLITDRVASSISFSDAGWGGLWSLVCRVGV